MPSTDDNDHDEYEIPLQDKRPYGSGLKRKRVVFVPASADDAETSQESTARQPSTSVSDMYLSIVLPKKHSDTTATSAEGPTSQMCEICALPIYEASEVKSTSQTGNRPHEASIAHQVCMTHSHPPSALDRSRMGLGVLQAQGWDPDSRTGLGAARQGIQHPIKAKAKNNTLGIGVQVPKELPKKEQKKPQTLDAKKARKMAAEEKKRAERLREQMFGNADVERYLGGG
ncbi:hypothetical protein F5Y15DRAFT_390181 [Xylariaceae sp. FL0016]|nr:hypothetical protein F5Y15DRAFT_390181 [Xylariaceae sp. FL0016]